MKQPKLKVEMFNVSELVPYVNNAKKHTKKQVSLIGLIISQNITAPKLH